VAPLPVNLSPYRIWLKHPGMQVPPALDEAIIAALNHITASNSALNREFGAGDEESWGVEQDTGKLTLKFKRGAPMVADVQIIGTHDGRSFMWAWANPSVDAALQEDAKALCEWGSSHGWELFKQTRFPASERDGSVMSALAATQLGAAGTFARSLGETSIFLTLRNPVRKRGLRIPRMKPQSRGILADLLSPLAGDYSELELSYDDHLRTKSLADEALGQLHAGSWMEAGRTLAKAWKMLAPHHFEMEPAGWIQSAWALAEYAAGDAAAAGERALELLAKGASTATAYAVLALSRESAGDAEGANRAWLSAYLMNGRESLADPTALDNALRTARADVDARVEARLPETPGGTETEKQAAAIVECLIEDWCKQETVRWKKMRSAERRRKQSHVMEPDEVYAEFAADEQWGAMLAAYFTPGRSPRCTAFSSPPTHDPAREHVQRVAAGETGFDVFSASQDSNGSQDLWRYSLKADGGRLLVEQIYSVWPDEEIPMFS